MAVYYKWIKGCAVGATLETGLWTYLKWGGNANSVNNADGSAGKTINNLPHIYAYIGKKDNPETENDLGYILTNAAEGITLTQPWILNDSFYFSPSTGSSFIQNNEAGNIKTNTSGYYEFTKGLYVQNGVELNSTLDVTGATTLNSTLNVTEATTLQSTLDVTGTINTNSSCTAEYFNAKSDKRAKENIRPANYSALDLIKKLPVYIYNYKNSHETVTGILAQDLLEAQPEELNLVSNINATGENNDYMSIKNDKLMFVLMKAIQEQQEQIEQLKSEIDNIKKSY